MSDPASFVFNNTCPGDRSYREHLLGQDGADLSKPDNGGARPGFGHYLLWLVDQVKGFRALVIHPRIAFILNYTLKVELTAAATRGRPAGMWRGHPVYLDLTINDCTGYISDRFDGERLGTFIVLNV